MSKPLVLVTGATGFIAKHCIAELLRSGYPVRGTVRRMERGPELVRRGLDRAGIPTGGLSFAAADLTRDEGWEAAASGCGLALHVASPFPLQQPRDWDELIIPAREGAQRMLRAATRAGVSRVVLTSSIVAVTYPSRHPEGHVFTEDDWSDPARPDITPYIASKTLAERAAWDFVRETPDAPQLAAINPALVLGPAIDPDLSTSHEIVRMMCKGYAPVAPRLSFPLCDVRDVAAAHVSAMLLPAAAGQRFLVVSGNLSVMELGRCIGEELPDLAGRMPRLEIPDWLVRGAALFSNQLAGLLPELGATRRVSNAKARDVLGLTPRAPEEAVRAAARSLRALKIV